MLSSNASSRSRVAALVQVGLAIAILPLLAFIPPSYGQTILVPVDGKPIGDALLTRSALHRLAPGPLPGSVIVQGEGRPLAATLLQQGIVMLAAPAGLCGDHSMHGNVQ
jgi:hypothetical protein